MYKCAGVCNTVSMCLDIVHIHLHASDDGENV